MHSILCPYYEVYLIKKEMQNKLPNALHNKDKKWNAFDKKMSAKIIFFFFAILKNKIVIGAFTYHPKCQALLLRADSQSLVVIKEALDEFYSLSGLQPNMQKSAIFFSGAGW